ncbi:hypothetical protein ACF3MZ_21250 [Paenibacillaceae bacterium WGS1546]|uniref:hypothetical protein n=1 Tax=Cohnella sp. WGS1546 TaxID=3366810 RepID=UPI00372D2383
MSLFPEELLTVVLPITGGVAGLISLYIHISRHIKERSLVLFKPIKGDPPSYFRIFEGKSDDSGQIIADESNFENGLRFEINIINRSIHPVSIYEVTTVVNQDELLLLGEVPAYHDRDHFMFREDILSMPTTIHPFESIRKVLFFNIKQEKPQKVKITFQTSRKKYVRTFFVPIVQSET